MILAEYITHMGNDLTVTNSARVSFHKESCFNEDGSLKESDQKLINYLANHGHWTPFSHPQIQMRETIPIFVARQRFKHMVGFTYNEVSRRYVDDTPEFYFPKVWRSKPDQNRKQGSSGNHPRSVGWDIEYREFIEKAVELYDGMIKDGVAPEQARMVLPQSMLTSYYVTGSLAAWARATKQRVEAHAQKEIQDLGHQWNKVIQPLFPISWTALVGAI